MFLSEAANLHVSRVRCLACCSVHMQLTGGSPCADFSGNNRDRVNADEDLVEGKHKSFLW